MQVLEGAEKKASYALDSLVDRFGETALLFQVFEELSIEIADAVDAFAHLVSYCKGAKVLADTHVLKRKGFVCAWRLAR